MNVNGNLTVQLKIVLNSLRKRYGEVDFTNPPCMSWVKRNAHEKQLTNKKTRYCKNKQNDSYP